MQNEINSRQRERHRSREIKWTDSGAVNRRQLRIIAAREDHRAGAGRGPYYKRVRTAQRSSTRGLLEERS